jgi:hypothetical protein
VAELFANLWMIEGARVTARGSYYCMRDLLGRKDKVDASGRYCALRHARLLGCLKLLRDGVKKRDDGLQRPGLNGSVAVALRPAGWLLPTGVMVP